MPDRSHYKTLQVDPTAEPDVIAAAYRALAAKLHPDRDITGVAEYRMRELNRAYAVLRDPDARAQYDLELAEAERAFAERVPMGPGAVGDGALTSRIAHHDAESLREIRLDFGRYEGWTLGEILRTDADYLRWLSRHSSGIRYRSAIMRLLAEHETGRTPLRVPR